MADTGPVLWEVLAVLAFLLLLLVVGYYALTRLRLRKKQLSLELDTAKELLEDRSFNQVRLARSEADLLEQRGVDVGRARTLLTEAEAARNRRDYDNALALARSAHEALVKMHQGLPLGDRSATAARPSSGRGLGPASPSSPPPLSGFGGATLASEGDDADPVESSAAAPPRPAIPRNKAESRFQLSLLAEELTRATTDAGPNAAVVEATEIQTLATTAFDKADFTEALRLALRARRRLGTRLETLPATAATKAPAPEGSEEPLTCRSCGEPLRANDRFCRYCGTLRGTARCAGCGAALEPDDKFCAACGRPSGDGAPG